MEALWISDSKNLARFECYQPQYSLVVRDIEQELIPLCEYKGLGVVVWSPLAGGYLSGKYRPGQPAVTGTRSEEQWAYPQRYFAPNADETLRALLDVAGELGRSPAQVALRWVIEQPAITAAIIGERTVEQARDNLLAASFRLEDAARERLDRISALPERYPQAMERDMHQRRDSAVKMPSG
jgi:aryl-alcohol dehydrogenase-like predicted oxidoreductase